MHSDSSIKLFAYKIAKYLIPDSLFVRLKFKKAMGKWPDLKHPKTYNEKLTWLKLHDHNPEYTRMVDKYEAKNYVANIIGEEYIIPTLAVWEKAEDIDFDKLPDKFVLKATHDSGRVIICKDKSKLNKEEAIAEMKKSLKRDFYAVTREWPYKNVKPRIIAEELLEPNDGNDISDFKVHNFNGIPKFILVCKDRFKEAGLTEDFFDTNWNHIEVKRPGYPNASVLENKPEELEKMLQISEKLSKDFPFIRTDFYSLEDKLYFGEITLYPASGAFPFEPEYYDDIFGKDLVISELGGGKLLISNNIAISIKINYPSDINHSINDYKFFCFNGEVKFMKIDFDRTKCHRANYYDREFNLLEFGEDICPPDFNRIFEKPSNFQKMIDFAEKIGSNIRFSRIDFYEVNNQLYFGEITFFPDSGTGKLSPVKTDLAIGNFLKL